MFDRAFAKAHKIAAAHGVRLQAQGRDPGFHVINKASRGELFIYGVIGDPLWGNGITDTQVIEALAKLKGVSQLDVRINSPGGSVFDGYGIYNAIKRFDAKKTVYVDGLAASAASFIAMAGDRIVTAENAGWMIHEAQGIEAGTSRNFRKFIKTLDDQSAAIAGMYAARTGRPQSDFFAFDAAGNPVGLMADETEFTAQEALAAKLTDEIEKNAGPVNDGSDVAEVAAQIPALRIAVDNEKRLANARKPALVLADMEQSLLHDRRAIASRRP